MAGTKATASCLDKRGQIQPAGQRKAAKYPAQASSLEKRFSNSSNVLG